jgi:hypothetical protein
VVEHPSNPVLLDVACNGVTSHWFKCWPPWCQCKGILVPNYRELTRGRRYGPVINPRDAVAWLVPDVCGIELAGEHISQSSSLTLAQKRRRFRFGANMTVDAAIGELLPNQPAAALRERVIEFSAKSALNCVEALCNQGTVEPSWSIVIDLVRNFDGGEDL